MCGKKAVNQLFLLKMSSNVWNFPISSPLFHTLLQFLLMGDIIPNDLPSDIEVNHTRDTRQPTPGNQSVVSITYENVPF